MLEFPGSKCPTKWPQFPQLMFPKTDHPTSNKKFPSWQTAQERHKRYKWQTSYQSNLEKFCKHNCLVHMWPLNPKLKQVSINMVCIATRKSLETACQNCVTCTENWEAHDEGKYQSLGNIHTKSHEAHGTRKNRKKHLSPQKKIENSQNCF